MNDWSDYALARLKKQREDQRFKDEKLLEIRRIKKSHGLSLWHEVRGIVKENSEHLNAKAKKEILVFQVTEETTIDVHANLDSGLRTLQATFDQETGKLFWECGSKSGQWELDITDNGGAQFKTTPASIAKQMLDELLFD